MGSIYLDTVYLVLLLKGCKLGVFCFFLFVCLFGDFGYLLHLVNDNELTYLV